MQERTNKMKKIYEEENKQKVMRKIIIVINDMK